MSVALLTRSDTFARDWRSSNRKSVLHAAAHHGTRNAILELLENNHYGVDVNALNRHGQSPLHLACKRAQVESIRLLVAYGASVNIGIILK